MAFKVTHVFILGSLTIVFVLYFVVKEGFALATREVCPTRNMSYDIRGDPLIIPRVALVFNNSTIGIKDIQACPMKRLE